MQILVLPWLALPRDVVVCDITVRSRNSAIANAGSHNEAVAKATSYFYERSRRRSRGGNALEFVNAEPSVVLLEDGDDALERAYIALDGLFFATMINAGPWPYANATSFTQFAVSNLSVAGSGYMRTTRSLFGSTTVMTEPDYTVEVRPAWCPERTPPANVDVLALYEAAVDGTWFAQAHSAIQALYDAMTDGPSPTRVEFEHYARAKERLLQRPGERRARRRIQQDAVARELFAAQIGDLKTMPDCAEDPTEAEVARAVAAMSPLSTDGVIAAMDRMIADRNATVHPDATVTATLHDQLVLRPNLVAFRLLSALILATLAVTAPAAWTSTLRAYVVAVVQWSSEYEDLTRVIAGLSEEQECNRPRRAIDRFGELWAYFNGRLRDE